MSVPQPLLPADEEQALHRRLCAEEAVAPSILCRTYFLSLVLWLQDRNRKLDHFLIEAAAEQSIISLIDNPRTYDPDRLDLFGYLRMAAEGDLKNLLAREKRHHACREAWIAVEKAEANGKCFGKGEEPLELLKQAEEQQATEDFFRACSDGWTEQEKQVLELMRRGEARTEDIARVLGMKDRPFAVQQEEANRMKDRLMKRLQREVQRRE